MLRAQRLLVVLALGFAVAVGGGASVPALAVAAAVPVAPYDALTIQGGPGLVPSGAMVKGARVYDASNATLTAATSGRYFHITAAPAVGGQSSSATVAPPVGGTLVAGSTYPTTSLSADSSQTYLSVFGPNSICGYLHGSLTVHEITQDASSGAITVFAATYSVVCNTTDTAVFRGEIRWHSTLGYAGLQTTGVPASGRVSFDTPTNTNSDPVTFSYSSRGSLPVAVRTPSLVGTGAQAFVITGSTCAGQILAFGESCTVSVLARPLEVGSHEAELVLATDLPGDGIAIPLSVYGSRNTDGLYFPVTPSRILDTRIGLGAPKAALGAGKTLNLQVGGAGLVAGYPEAGVPAAGVGAVVLNLTATVPTADTYLTAYPSLQARPVASNLNVRKGATVANMVTVRLSDLGSLDIYNNAGSTHVIADVIGYYPDDTSFVGPWPHGSAFHTVPARRILDTRAGSNQPTWPAESKVVIADFGPAVNPFITALAVNITVTAPQYAGYLAAWGTGPSAEAWVSTLNFTPGSTVSNMSLVPVSPGGPGLPTFEIFNRSDGFVDLVVDVFGYYEYSDQTGGLHFRPSQPVRIVDTRTGKGTTKLGAGTATITTPSALIGPESRALVTNTTLVAPAHPTYLTLWPAVAGPRPGVSNVNALAGQVVASSTVTQIAAGGKFNLYNNVGTTNALVDVAGTFAAYPSP
jgi:hypothetical protein